MEIIANCKTCGKPTAYKDSLCLVCQRITEVSNANRPKGYNVPGVLPVENSQMQAQIALASVLQMVRALHNADESNSADLVDAAKDLITNAALSVEVRSAWHEIGSGSRGHGEYTILLAAGAPAVRMIGFLDHKSRPLTARFEFQFATSWAELRLTSDEEKAVLTFASCFYYDEEV